MLRFIVFGLLGLVFVPSPCVAEDNTHKPLKAEVFGAWSLICPEKVSSKSVCYIAQSVAGDPKGEKVLLGISVSFIGTPKTPRIDFRFSSAALKDAGIGLKIDNADEFRLPITNCDTRLCMASGVLDENMQARLKKGTFCQFAYYVLPDKKQVTLPVSLNGFSKAFSTLTRMVW